MTKIFSKQFQSTHVKCVKIIQLENSRFKSNTGQSKTVGSSMIELLLAVFLALVAVSTSAELMSKFNNSGLNRRAAATSAIEVAISNDLAWFRQYAKLWRLQEGPFKTNALSKSVTHTAIDYTKSTSSKVYTPISCNSSEMATTFRTNAAALTTHVSPINSPPYTFLNNDKKQEIILPAVTSKYKLERELIAGSVSGTLNITYTLTESDKPGNTIFKRSNSVYLPAAGWCP
jgi:hypothetical protein